MAVIMSDVFVRGLVQRWLDELGGPNRDVDSVYQVLKDAGIKGRPLRAADCPVAKYLNAQFEAMGMPYCVLVGHNFATVRRLAGRPVFVTDVVLPAYIQDFTTAFDERPSFAPELRESEV